MVDLPPDARVAARYAIDLPMRDIDGLDIDIPNIYDEPIKYSSFSSLYLPLYLPFSLPSLPPLLLFLPPSSLPPPSFLTSFRPYGEEVAPIDPAAYININLPPPPPPIPPASDEIGK
jgi:hypothetical protein